MKFVEVKEIPGKRENHRLKDKWEEFMASNIKIAKVDLKEDEYASAHVASSVMRISIKHYGYPITVIRRGDEIYLVRRDM